MIIKVCAAGIALGIGALLMRELGFRGAPVFAVTCIVVLLTVVADGAGELRESIGIISAMTRSEAEVSAVVKIVGVGYLVGISSDICTELGERGIAKAVAVAGRVEILAIALPFFRRLLEYGAELLS